MGREVSTWKQIMFHSSQMFNQRGLSINILVMTTLLHEAAFISACHVSCSCFLSFLICFLQGHENWKAVLSGSRNWTCKSASTPPPQWHPGGKAGRLQTQPTAFIFLRPRQSIIPEPSSLTPSEPRSPQAPDHPHSSGPLHSHTSHHIQRHWYPLAYKKTEAHWRTFDRTPLSIAKQAGDGGQHKYNLLISATGRVSTTSLPSQHCRWTVWLPRSPHLEGRTLNSHLVGKHPFILSNHPQTTVPWTTHAHTHTEFCAPPNSS